MSDGLKSAADSADRLLILAAPHSHRRHLFRNRDVVAADCAPGAQLAAANVAPDGAFRPPGDSGTLLHADQIAGDGPAHSHEEFRIHVAASLSASGSDGRVSAAADQPGNTMKKP